MYVVSSIPIVKGIPKDVLTYFSTQAVAVGDIVTVVVQSREIRAVAVSVQDARELRETVRRGDFALKKILKVEKGFLPASLIAAAKETAEYYVTSVSKVLGAMLPKNVLAEAGKQELGVGNWELGNPSSSGMVRGGFVDVTCIEGSQIARFEWILKNVIKGGKRILYISPSNHELAKANKFFKEQTQGSLLGHTKDCLVFASPEYGFVWLPYVDTIILDHASGAGYYDHSSAKIDFKKTYELHAKKNNQHIIFSDSVLDLKFIAQGSLVHNLSNWPKVTVVKKERRVDHVSWLVSKDAVSLVKKTLENGGQIFFFAPRKSIASMTLCGDCGEIVECRKCKRSLTLARKNNRQIFFCQGCKEVSDSNMKCAQCDSWKLSPLGVTVESVAGELERLFPRAHVLRISSDVTKTKTALAKVITQFYATTGAILVGTELAIPYLEKQVSYSVISSIDAFLSGRSLSGTDKATRIIFDVSQVSDSKVLVETSDVTQQFFKDTTSCDLKKYRDRELAERKKFNYPPYSMIIKVGGETHFINRENWPDEKLTGQIRTLPKGVSYEIDADRAV